MGLAATNGRFEVLDTAERYADGESERAIGEWIRQRPRELTSKVRIATKVAPPTADGVDGTRFDRAYIEGKLKASLERLGLERVTFYLCHSPDTTTPIEETVEGFAAVIEAGRVGHVACCNGSAEELIEALDFAQHRIWAIWPKRSIWCWPRRIARRSLRGSWRQARRRSGVGR